MKFQLNVNFPIKREQGTGNREQSNKLEILPQLIGDYPNREPRTTARWREQKIETRSSLKNITVTRSLQPEAGQTEILQRVDREKIFFV